MGQNRRENSVSARNRAASTGKMTGGRRRGMGGGMKAGGKVKVDVGGAVGMKKGGKCRGKGAAKRGYNTSKKMG